MTRRTQGSVLRDVRRRAWSRRQQRRNIKAMKQREREGHAPLCAMHYPHGGGCRCDDAIACGWVPPQSRG
jgi:hypothetical protein